MSEPQRTPDGRYLVVNGRRWRASDPAIPDALRQELVDELMAARRLVRTDPETARPRVQDAKVALGERGYVWWSEPTAEELTTRIEAATRALLRHRAGKTICPSDVARVVGGDAGDSGDAWRNRMPHVREIAYRLQDEGELVVTQRGEAVGRDARGPVRIAFTADDETSGRP